MAGDWIPMRTNLRDDPAVIQIAEATGLTEFTVVGMLHSLWSWASENTLDGDARSVTLSWIDRHVGVTGFAEATLQAGWLERSGRGFRFPKFERWMSETAKKRVLTRIRMRRMRGKNVTQPASHSCHENVTLHRQGQEKKKGKNPSSTAPADAPTPATAPTAQQLLFGVVAEVTAADPVVNKTHIGKVATLLAAADPPFTPAEVRDFAGRYQQLCPWAKDNGTTRPTLGEVEKFVSQVRAKPPARTGATTDDITRRMLDRRRESERLERERLAHPAVNAILNGVGQGVH